jgi:hypothetical protein
MLIYVNCYFACYLKQPFNRSGGCAGGSTATGRANVASNSVPLTNFRMFLRALLTSLLAPGPCKCLVEGTPTRRTVNVKRIVLMCTPQASLLRPYCRFGGLAVLFGGSDLILPSFDCDLTASGRLAGSLAMALLTSTLQHAVPYLTDNVSEREHQSPPNP